MAGNGLKNLPRFMVAPTTEVFSDLGLGCGNRCYTDSLVMKILLTVDVGRIGKIYYTY